MAKNTNKTTTSKTASKANTADATASAVKTETSKPGSGYDALGGRIGSRTNAIHRVLIVAAKKGERLKSGEIAERAQKLLIGGADHPSYAKLPSTVGPHMNTMKVRGYVANEGGYYLTDAGRAEAGLPKMKKGK